ncbi:ferredoxin [Pseudoruegeria sp. SHC-113]|uniref:ferredoxin n=1 Tax=Pseudoruegeria sp. SHC-113 TaxID=2855439 RepID=UPI0021BB82C7|nr:ferredoxin [Pseudoruegeria sp. SHC-113]MCT8161436.1 ferredoxin [Pseudoruegeria sp. SHC-113]
MTLDERLATHGLFVMGGLHPGTGGSLLLIGMDSTGWAAFTAAPEASDGGPDPLDRFSKRVIGGLAEALGGTAQFPSDGPPYLPFIAWALESGAFWQSPVGMMVHARAGLMISLRGALLLPERVALPPVPAGSPCEACADQPCRTTCPVDALGGPEGYNVSACKDFLASAAGSGCYEGGCLARRVCPVSEGFGRTQAQSAFHMRAFFPK